MDLDVIDSFTMSETPPRSQPERHILSVFDKKN